MNSMMNSMQTHRYHNRGDWTKIRRNGWGWVGWGKTEQPVLQETNHGFYTRNSCFYTRNSWLYTRNGWCFHCRWFFLMFLANNGCIFLRLLGDMNFDEMQCLWWSCIMKGESVWYQRSTILQNRKWWWLFYFKMMINWYPGDATDKSITVDSLKQAQSKLNETVLTIQNIRSTKAKLKLDTNMITMMFKGAILY